jgi:hypothetical protein
MEAFKTFTIVYKSGAKVQVRAKSMTVKRYTTGRIEIEWGEMHPRPMLLGVDEIAAIFEGKV